jgi:hypothetical protein
LWNEYELDIGGRKPAKDFLLHERGKVKNIYSLCNAGWQIISGLVRLGHTSEVAIDRIYAVYGSQPSVTVIQRSLKKDVKAGRRSPNLQIQHLTLMMGLALRKKLQLHYIF